MNPSLLTISILLEEIQTWMNDKLVLKADQGVVAVHPGMFTHKHGVRPIVSGERYAMVSFCRLNF